MLTLEAIRHGAIRLMVEAGDSIDTIAKRDGIRPSSMRKYVHDAEPALYRVYFNHPKRPWAKDKGVIHG